MSKVYIGYDEREHTAYEVAADSLVKNASAPVHVTSLHLDVLERQGLMTREHWKHNGRHFDVRSGAYQSTDFANSRFFVPLLAHTGWALFVDCDVVFLGDVAELFAMADPKYAVMCVQHSNGGGVGTKMDDQPQQKYNRKNWSSVMLFNCDHPANHALSPGYLNTVPGRDLHAFGWLDDELIGALPAEWNWLVGVQDKPENTKLAHFTLGGPWMRGWKGAEHDEIFNQALFSLRGTAQKNQEVAG